MAYNTKVCLHFNYLLRAVCKNSHVDSAVVATLVTDLLFSTAFVAVLSLFENDEPLLFHFFIYLSGSVIVCCVRLCISENISNMLALSHGCGVDNSGLQPYLRVSNIPRM